jgi:hypothetical protein
MLGWMRQELTSDMPTGTKPTRPMVGLSAWMRKIAPALHVVTDAERGGLTSCDDDVVVLGRGDGTRSVAEPAGQEDVPRREAPIRVVRVVLVLLDADRPSGVQPEGESLSTYSDSGLFR